MIDLDGNRIGAMYRFDTPHPVPSNLGSNDAQRISRWQDDVAARSEAKLSNQDSPKTPRIIVNNITTSPAVEVHRIKQDVQQEGEISTRAIIGTILGATAGAAVAYAMAKSESDKMQRAEPQHVTYRAIEPPPQRLTEIIYQSPDSIRSDAQPIRMIDNEVEDLVSRYSKPSSRIKTVASSNARKSGPATEIYQSSQNGRTIAQTNGTKVLVGESGMQSTASKKLHRMVVQGAEGTRSPSSTHHASVRSAKDIALPPSRVATNVTAASMKEEHINDMVTVVPDDSISQVSTRRSSNHPSKAEHRHHHHHHSRSGHSKHSRRSSHGSSKTIKASENQASTSRR